MASDPEIANSIDALVQEEHRLWEAESRGEAGEAERRRLGEIKVALDQCWDLLRQRRALEEFGRDPDGARVRPEEVVERYEQ
jgi:glycine/D-amino acid oxidase-like deaminating enzyme